MKDLNNRGSNFPHRALEDDRRGDLQWLTQGSSSANVLHKYVEASELLKGSYRDHPRRSSEDKNSLSSSGHHGACF
jgi:hypothetical protein